MGLPDFNTQTKRNVDRAKCEKSDEITVIYACFYEIFGQVYELELRNVRILNLNLKYRSRLTGRRSSELRWRPLRLSPISACVRDVSHKVFDGHIASIGKTSAEALYG